MLKHKIIDLIYKHPRTLIGLCTVFILISITGLPKLEKEYSQKSWFRSGDPLVKNFDAFKEKYGSDISLITILSFKDSVFKEANLKRAYNITEKMWTIPNFVRVDSLTNYSYTESINDEIVINPFVKDPTEFSWDKNYLNLKQNQATSLDQIQNYLISKDQKTIAIYSSFKHVEGRESGTFKDTVAIVREKIIKEYQSDDLKIMLTGPAVVGTTFEEESLKDFIKIIPIALIILFIILNIILRNMVATVLTIGLIVLTLLTMLGIQGHLGIRIGLVTGMCPLIVLAICVADSIHIFSTYFQSKIDGYEDPLMSSLNKNLYPTFLTTLTTSLGFLALCGAELYPIADMGITATVGIITAWSFTVFLICPLLQIIPIKKQYAMKYQFQFFNFNRVHEFIIKYPKQIVSVVLIMSSMSFFFSTQNTVDSNMLNYFAKHTDFRKATDFFEKTIGGTESIELIIKSGEPEGIKDPKFLNKIENFIDKVYTIPDVTKVNSILAPLKEVNQVLNNNDKDQYKIASTQEKIAQELFFLELSLPPTKNLNNLLNADRSDTRISIYWTRSSSKEIMKGSKLIEQMMKDAGLNGHVTGTVPLISGLDGYIVRSFFESMCLAIVFIALLMMFVFKSVFYGLFSMIPNIIVPSFGAAALYFLNIPFDAGCILIFSICLGIAIDDTIFFLTNLQVALTKKQSLKASLKEVLLSSGNTLSFTTLILVTVFSLFYLGSFIPNQTFAIATSIILTSALVLDLVFLPSLILVINQFKKAITR